MGTIAGQHNVQQHHNNYYKRVIGALVLGFAVSVAGYSIGQYLQGLYNLSNLGDHVPYPLSWLFRMIGSPFFLSATLLIAAGREALGFIPAVRKILRGEHWMELWLPSTALFCSLFALGFALPNKLPDTNPSATNESHQRTNVGSTVFLNFGDLGVYHSPDRSKGLLTLAVTFSKDNPSHTSEEGVTVEEHSRELLMRIGHALAMCEGENGIKAHIEVVGFASSLGPVDKPALYRQVELTVAQTRADHVMGIIVNGAREAKPTGSLPIEIAAPAWPSYDKMESEIRFRDLVDKQYDELLGNFTRRAEIRLKSAGKCEISSQTSQKTTVAQK